MAKINFTTFNFEADRHSVSSHPVDKMSGEVQARSRKRNAKGAFKQRKQDFESLRNREAKNEFDHQSGQLRDSSQSLSQDRACRSTSPSGRSKSGSSFSCCKFLFFVVLAVFMVLSLVIYFDYRSFKDNPESSGLSNPITVFVSKSFSKASLAVSSLISSLLKNSSREAKFDSEDYTPELNEWIHDMSENEDISEQEMVTKEAAPVDRDRPVLKPEVVEPEIVKENVPTLGPKSSDTKQNDKIKN